MFALPFGLFFGPTEALVFEVFFATCGTLTFGGFACLQHLSVRILLACKGLAPLRYVRFLDDAAHHMLLHRVGSGYIFIHRLLLEHLAGVSRA